MQAEVISIGDELITGQRLDTNTQWLSQQLGELGIEVVRHSTVGDDLAGNVDAFRLAADRADIVVCTGGLGPTQDDLTRQAMAEAFDLELVFHEPSLVRIKKMFASRNRTMPESNRIQAMFPAGSQVVVNPHGTAPGIDLSVVHNGATSRIFAFPGVPAEMKQMWAETVVESIESMLGAARGKMRFHTLKVFGIGESDVEGKLPRLIDRDRTPTVGITVSRATISLRIAGRTASESEFEQLIAPTVQEIHAALGQLVFGEDDDELEDVVLRGLKKKNKTLATVEIGAASLIGDGLLQCDLSADGTYRGSLAFPCLNSARSWFSVDESKSLSPEETWREIAVVARERFSCDLLLLVGVYPNQSTMELAESSFPIVWALADCNDVDMLSREMGGHPDVLLARIAKSGLDLARKRLAD